MTRFDAFADRKTAGALSAIIEPFETDVDRAGGDVVAIGNAWSRRLFDGCFYVPHLLYPPFLTSLISNSFGHHLPVMKSRSCAAS